MYLKIDGLPKTPNVLFAKHWRTRHGERDKWHELVALHVLSDSHRRAVPSISPYPFKKAELKLYRHSSRMLDYDGLVGSFKYVVDGLVACGILEDDSYLHIGVPEFYWIKAPPKKGYVEIYVTGRS